MEVPYTLDILVSGLLLIGLFFLLTGTFGLLRLKDVYTRMHATSKSTTFGVAGVVLARAILPAIFRTLLRTERVPDCHLSLSHRSGWCAYDRPGCLSHRRFVMAGRRGR